MGVPINIPEDYAPYSFLAARTAFQKNADGFYIVKLGVFLKDPATGKTSAINVCNSVSGAIDKQNVSNFRIWEESKRDIQEPCPQGTFDMEGPPDFAGGPNNYQVDHSKGLGPVFVTIHVPYAVRKNSNVIPEGDRSILIHLDGGSKGTAGCLGIQSQQNLKELKLFITAIQTCMLAGSPPQKIFVDWGLPMNPKLSYPPNVNSIISRGLGISLPSVRLKYKLENDE